MSDDNELELNVESLSITEGTTASAVAATDDTKFMEPTQPFDDVTKSTVQKIPMLKTKAGPRDGDKWIIRLKEELQALIAYVKMNKDNDNDWFTIKSNANGTKWEGKCWHYYENNKYEFDLCFDIPVTYPATAPEIRIPELDGKTVKMYHGGKICLTIHFNPLWTKNVPKFGIAHALALGKVALFYYFKIGKIYIFIYLYFTLFRFRTLVSSRSSRFSSPWSIIIIDIFITSLLLQFFFFYPF